MKSSVHSGKRVVLPVFNRLKDLARLLRVKDEVTLTAMIPHTRPIDPITPSCDPPPSPPSPSHHTTNPQDLVSSLCLRHKKGIHTIDDNTWYRFPSLKEVQNTPHHTHHLLSLSRVPITSRSQLRWWFPMQQLSGSQPQEASSASRGILDQTSPCGSGSS